MMNRALGLAAVITAVASLMALLFIQSTGLVIVLWLAAFGLVSARWWLRVKRERDEARAELRRELRSVLPTGAWEGRQSGSPPFPEAPYIMMTTGDVIDPATGEAIARIVKEPE